MLLSNLGRSAHGAPITVGTIRQAQGFTTGSNTGGYHLRSIELDVFEVPNTPTDVTVELWSATSGATPEPNASVATLTHSTRTWTTGLNTLNAPADTQLDANTTYFLILSYSGRRAFLNISATDETSADGGGAAGWSVGQRFDGVADSWSFAALRLKFRVNGRR